MKNESMIKNIYSTSEISSVSCDLDEDSIVTCLNVWNVINGYEFDVLCSTLKDNTSIEYLYFTSCNIDVKKLVESLKLNTTIKVLGFHDCSGDFDIFDLEEYLTETTSIREFYLSDQYLYSYIEGFLLSILNKNKSIQKISLHTCYDFSDNFQEKAWRLLYKYPRDIDLWVMDEHVLEENFYFDELKSDWYFNKLSSSNSIFMDYIYYAQPYFVQVMFLLNYHDQNRVKTEKSSIFVDLFSSEYFDVHLLFIVFEFAMRLKRTAVKN